MAKVVLVDLEQLSAGQICRVIAVGSHQIEHRSHDVALHELLDADIVFAGGEAANYISLLRRVREARPTLRFVVVTPVPKTTEWLDALEAGATDCCSLPIDTRQFHWLMETGLPPPGFAAA